MWRVCAGLRIVTGSVCGGGEVQVKTEMVFLSPGGRDCVVFYGGGHWCEAGVFVLADRVAVGNPFNRLKIVREINLPTALYS